MAAGEPVGREPMNGKLTPRSYYLHVPGGRTAMLALAVIVSAILSGAGGYVFFTRGIRPF